MIRTVYHTQEHRHKKLEQPIICVRDDAWLGEGYYFWYQDDDAYMWGKKSKKKTGRFEIYHAEIDCTNVLDTVFDENHYLFWIKQITKTAEIFIKKTGKKPTIKELNDYFREKGIWSKVTGILFQDIPDNPELLLIQPIEQRNTNRTINFVYRKRIQLVIFNLSTIRTFVLRIVDTC